MTERTKIFALLLLIIFFSTTTRLVRSDVSLNGTLSRKSPSLARSFVANVTTLLNTLLRKDKYDVKLRPGKGRPVVVKVDIDVRSMGPINEKKEEFSLDCYFRQRWHDDRLDFSDKANMSQLVLANSMLKDIWKPDTYIRNSKGSYLHKLTVPNILLRVLRNGQVYISQRLTIITKCSMHFRKYPADSQACDIEIGSLGHSVNDIQYTWNSLEINRNIKLSQYKLTGVAKSDQNVTDPRGSHFDDLSVVKVYFRLKRQLGYYLLQVFLPMLLIVVISWVSFWIDKDASPARVSLGVLTVLNMSTLGTGHREHLPKVGYSTALDLYIVGCFVFLFAAVVEYASINFVEKKRDRKSMNLGTALVTHTPDGIRSKKVSTVTMSYIKLNTPSGSVRRSPPDKSQLTEPVKESSPVDRYSKHLFPLFFTIFNLTFVIGVCYVMADAMPYQVVFEDVGLYEYD